RLTRHRLIPSPDGGHPPMRRPGIQGRYGVLLVAMLLAACETAAPGSATPAPSVTSSAASEAPASSAASASPTAEPTPVGASAAAGLAFVRAVDGVAQLF